MQKIILLLFALPIGLQAQIGTAVLETSGARLQIPANGMLFNDVANQGAGYEVPLGSGNHTLYNSSLWVGGISELGELRLAGLTYCDNGSTETGFCEYYPGPLKTIDATTTEEVMEQYNRVWVVRRDQADLHIAYFNCLSDFDCDLAETFPDGYETPDAFLDWPAHGDVSLGYAADLAPFVDVDTDGVYNPENGDYPEFCGDQAAYLIINDGGFHFESLSTSIGLEIHTMVYAYEDEGVLGSSVYVRQKLINRSQDMLESTYIGVWSDFDIGGFSDDFIGTDVKRGMVYAYNADSFDLDYGDDLPAMGCVILQGPLADSNGVDDEIPYEGFAHYGRYVSGWGDGIVDNESIGLNSGTAIYTSGPFDVQTPNIGMEFYNYLQGKWKTGLPLVHGNIGFYNTDSELLNTRYVFPGTTDPMHDGTDGEDPEDELEGWTELTANTFPSDRRMLASMGPFSFEPGSEETIEYAYVFAQQSQDFDTPVIELLGLNADQIIENQCTLSGDITTGLSALENHVEFSIYPNPSQGEFTLRIEDENRGTYRVFNIVGQEIANGKLQFPNTSITLGNVKQGMYFVSVDAGNAQSTKKIVIE